MEGEARPSNSSGLPLPAPPFALRLARQLSEAAGGGKNLVFSPLSIQAALALVAVGSGGDTLDEFLALLGASSRDELVRGAAESALALALADMSRSGGPRVASACAVWHDAAVALSPAYRDAAVESFKAETRAADLHHKPKEAREEINSWVSEATNELITSILPEGSVSSNTVLVLANAVYFRGKWSRPFAREDTEDRPFYRLDGGRVLAPFMRSRADQFVREHDGFKVLKLPYRMQHPPAASPSKRSRHGGGAAADEWHYQRQSDESGASSDDKRRPRFSMCVFLPDARDGLPGLVDRMAAAGGASFLRDHLPARRVKVGEFRLPRFKLSSSSDMSGTLKAMGLRAVFDDRKADLSEMLEDGGSGGGGGGRLCLEHAFHKAVVEVNEEGTEAAASTACVVGKRARVQRTDFVADHPFAFFVVEEVSGAVVFMGHVLDPTMQED